MTSTTRVNLHCHSVCSDGSLQPEELAQRLADDGVVVAALTDHDTTDGSIRFRAALQRLGVGTINGTELTSTWHGEEVHLLVYGFDAANAEWQAALKRLRLTRYTPILSVEGAMRRAGSAGPAAGDDTSAAEGPLATEEAIALAHRAGGQVFLAHPHFLRQEERVLQDLISDLRDCGLDGIEALYDPASADIQARLVQMAKDLNLLVSAGTDYHDPANGRAHGLGVDMPNVLWQPLRDALKLETSTSSERSSAAYTHARRTRRPFARHVIIPSVLAIVLFIVTIWALLIPAFERALVDRKREMIRELTHAAWSIMAEAEHQVLAGRLTQKEAQAETRERISALRYGHENKDYFWLQDMYPRMIMHPYRPDLDGHDLSDYRDPLGAPIFVEFADLVRRHNEGYIDYVWQWPDDPRRLEPKESYVKGFAPWGWVIGTGLYIEDVKLEIAHLERGLIHASLLITALVTLLLIHVMRHSRKIDRERVEAVEELNTTTERYRSFVEAATEGTLLVAEGRCRYANPYLLTLLGYSASELELLGFSEILPQNDTNLDVWERIEGIQKANATDPKTLTGSLRRRDGSVVSCALVINRIALGSRAGLVLLARESSLLLLDGAVPLPVVETPLTQTIHHVPCGLFRASADRYGTLLATNDIASRCLSAAAGTSDQVVATLADAFGDRTAFESFEERLKLDGTATCRLLSAPDATQSTATFTLRATIERDIDGQPIAIDGLIEDITSLVRREQERDAVIERLQSSQLFLHEPVSSVVKKGVFCSSDMPVRQVATLLAARDATAALVCDSSHAMIGLATVRDLCERVLAMGLDSRTPVRTVMSAPVATVPANTPIYGALLQMQERNLHHLVVTDDSGQAIGTLCDRDLLPLQQYGAGSLTSEISHATLVEDIVRGCRRTAATVKALLDSGATPRNVTRFISSVCDAATERFVQLTIEELGPPPARFAFIALGSQGRQEQTLITDQDNAIIYESPEPSSGLPDVAPYFQELGRRVCGWLAEAGYPFCHGRFMAKNPVWTRPLSAWKTHFSYWIAQAEPEELLVFSLFFDFNTVCGDASLVEALRQHVFADLRESPAFFPHFARDVLKFKPPVMVLGHILMGGVENAPRGTLDIKSALLPIVAFARLYALRHEIVQTGTLARLDALADAGKIAPASRDEIAAAFSFLTRLRLQQQARAIHEGRTPDNLVEFRRLGYTDRTVLRQSISTIRVLQRRIAYDFLGGTQG